MVHLRRLEGEVDWNEIEWNEIIDDIMYKRYAPFLGAGAGVPWLPLAGTIAKEWAEKYDYPLEDKTNLANVSQFMAIDKRNDTFE
jgi:hypothetical protein